MYTTMGFGTQGFVNSFSRIFWYNGVVNNMEIENLSLEERVELHRKICKPIRELNRSKVSEKLENFEIGDEISFKHEGNLITGTVIRVNRKSLKC